MSMLGLPGSRYRYNLSRRRRQPSGRKTPVGAKWVPLTRGHYALVDANDWLHVTQYAWHATKGSKAGCVYARRKVWVSHLGCYEGVYLHRYILGELCADAEVDHISGDTLDCRRSNLRLADRSQNAANQKQLQNQTGFRGVRRNKSGRYYGEVTWRGCRHRTRSFVNALGAAAARDDLAARVQGEFARFNFPR